MEEVRTYARVAAIDELREGFLSSHVVEGRELVVARTVDGVFAYDATCPHADFQFGPARLRRGCEIECQMHGARFKADESGAVTKGPAKEPLEMLETRVADGHLEIFVDWLF